MGMRLMPAILKALGGDVAPMSAIDRRARLEQLGWLPSAEAWATLRQIRHQFTHDYPDAAAERFDRLQAATAAAGQLLTVMDQFAARISKLLSAKPPAPSSQDFIASPRSSRGQASAR